MFSMDIRERYSIMDWGKAKTYLIIAFTITNIILMFSIFSDRTDENSYFTKESYESLEQFLLQKNLNLHTELPKETPKMGTLKVEYQSFDLRDLESRFLEYKSNIEILGDKTLTLKAKRKLTLFDTDHAKSDTKLFIDTYDLGKDFDLKYASFEGENLVVVYNSVYKNRFLEDSYMKFTYFPDESFEFEMLKMNPVEESKNKKIVMTSIEAVMRASNMMEENETITEVVLGYNYAQYESLSIAKTKTATAFPCWRIKTKENQYYYIEALEF